MAVIAVCIFLTACRKFDFKFRDPALHCQIDVITGDLEGTTLHRKFHYNEFGNPTLVEYVETEGGTGTPNFYFYYNDKQQLIEMIGYGTHRYYYNSLGQIVIDSSYEYYTGGDARFETKFYYDLYGRVARLTRKYYYDMFEQEGLGETTTWQLKYDRKGNLVRDGVTYDNKTNISRTHPLWMFLNLDYSINNPIKATGYNAAGLPTSFGEGFLNFLESSMFNKTVEYNCDDTVK